MGTTWRRPRRFDADLLVIGAGSGGLVAAYIAATLKARVTLVEANAMGGDCLNSGCVPSKALIHAARVARTIRGADRFGVSAGEPVIDFPRVMARVHEAIRSIAPHDSVERYSELGVDVIAGHARLVTPWEVAITASDGSHSRVTARAIVLATGAEPAVPPLPGLDTVAALTSENLWQLEELPERLLVLGGGPIGCELGQAFAGLGSAVTLVGGEPRLLPREDADAGERLRRRLEREGVDLRLGHHGEAVRATADGGVLTTRDGDGARHDIPFDRILLAVGRRPRLHGYGLEALGLVTDASRDLPVNGLLRTAVPNIYACGDLVGPYQFTHAAAHQAWHATVNALFAPLARFRVNHDRLPWATFTDPEIARVGLNEQEARERGIRHEVTRYELADLDRALIEDDTAGFVKILTPPGRDRILGATLVGPRAGDLVAEFVLAMQNGIGLKALLRTIHIYPTHAEANRHVAGAWRRAHAPGWLLDRLEFWHRLRRGFTR